MLKKAWIDPVWSKVIATAIIGAVSIAVAFFSGWWPAILKGISTAAGFLGTSTAFPHWAIIVMALLSLTAPIVLGALLWARARRNTTSSPPDWIAYNSDLFLGLRWRWTYTGTQISTLLSYCPDCDYQLHPQRGKDYGSYSITEFHCDNCSKTVASFKESYSELTGKAERLAQMKIRNGLWAVQGGT